MRHAPVPAYLVAAVAEPGLRRGEHDHRSNLDKLDFEPPGAA